MFLGRNALHSPTLKQETVTIASLGGEVILSELSVADRLRASKVFAAVAEGDTDGTYRALLAQVAMSLRNEDGSPMCGPDDIAGMVESLMQHPGKVVDELTSECMRIQGIGKEDLKETVGNSDEIPS